MIRTLLSLAPKATQDSGVAKIRALLLAARPALNAEARSLSAAFKQPLAKPGDSVPDRSPSIALLIEHLKKLREDVGSTAVAGAAALSARDLSVQALLQTEQALGKLVESYGASDQRSAIALLDDSARLLAEAKGTSAKAGKALGIPWPLQ